MLKRGAHLLLLDMRVPWETPQSGRESSLSLLQFQPFPVLLHLEISG